VRRLALYWCSSRDAARRRSADVALLDRSRPGSLEPAKVATYAECVARNKSLWYPAVPVPVQGTAFLWVRHCRRLPGSLRSALSAPSAAALPPISAFPPQMTLDNGFV